MRYQKIADENRSLEQIIWFTVLLSAAILGYQNMGDGCPFSSGVAAMPAASGVATVASPILATLDCVLAAQISNPQPHASGVADHQ